jgi:Predicted membrane protein (DUF2339)
MDTQQQSVGLTIDMVIARFIPIIGALLFITGLWYLIYTSIWQDLAVTMRLGVGFFVSVAIIGTAFSLSDKLRYFADVVMGGGILLLYGTLLYGSRTTDIAVAAIPEVMTLVTAFIFTLGVAYFASLRRSKVILALGILGAYLTPFILWQNDSWAHNISFNAFLTYFAAVNIVIFVLGREIAIYDLIPLNLLWLFFGTYSLHVLSYAGMTQSSTGFLAGDIFTVILLAVLVIMSISGIALSSSHFTDKKESTLLAFGYLIPLTWFMVHMGSLAITPLVEMIAYIIVAIAYFAGWYILRPLAESRYQHVAVYTWGIIALISALMSLFPEFNIYTSLIIAYVGLLFALIYIIDGNKWERLIASVLATLFGGIFSLIHIYGDATIIIIFPTLVAVVSLIPAILLAPLVHVQGKTPASVADFVNIYSIAAGILAVIIIFFHLIDFVDFGFACLILPGMILVLATFIWYIPKEGKGTAMRIGTTLVSAWFFFSFFYFFAALAPHVADSEYFFQDGAIFSNWHFIKGICALVTYFLALSISRDIQREDKADRPSFLLVIVGYATLLLMINFAIITVCNDLGIAHTTGGPRAIGTTIWWIILSIGMLMIGIHHGYGYRSEKLLWLLLLLLTIAKIGLYDLATMDMDKKIIVLMVVGWVIMMFSYFLQVKWYLKEEHVK